MSESRFNLLVPALRAAPSRRVLDCANGLLKAYEGSGTVLSIVEIPEERSLSEGALIARRRRTSLRKAMPVIDNPQLHTEVRTAHSLEDGVRAAAREMRADLLLMDWQPRSKSAWSRSLDRVLADPPCDVAVVKQGKCADTRTVLVPARGGPHALLALRLAQAIAAEHGAVLTLLHVNLRDSDSESREHEERYFASVAQSMTYANVRLRRVDAESVQAALTEEAARHDLVVMGAGARDEKSSYSMGKIPESLAHRTSGSVVIVKTREPVTAGTFGLAVETLAPAEYRSISELVDRWFAENTFHSHEFRNIRYLISLKERQGKTISLAIPTLNEEKTIGRILSTIKRQLVERYPLIDELVVIDSNSDDRTVEIASSLGIRVFKHPDILPHYGSYSGKGEALWKSLHVTKGDIVAWVDSDITGFHPRFVYGLLGPLLSQSRLGFVKGFYRRPLNLGGQLLTTGGGRVTELTARPLINLFFPELSGLVQPLAGEMAGRRDVLEAIPFFTGYGVETGLLVDVLGHSGLETIAQVDLEYRVHRNQTLLSLSKMAFAIVQVVMKRLGDHQRLLLNGDISTSMKLIHYSPAELFLEVKEIREHERPAIIDLPEYRSTHARTLTVAGAIP